jgi:diacylglycerol kinase family enzyme
MGLIAKIERAISGGEDRARRRALVLFNPKAGGVRAEDKDRLAAALAEAGVEEATFGDAFARNPFVNAARADLVVVLGGDGTARAIAARAPRDAPPLILLPGGTLNILPRALYGQRAWPEALSEALAHGRVQRLSLGRANGKPFFVAAAFGAPTLLARAREAVREGRYLHALRGVRHFASRSFSRSLRARPGGERMRKAEAIGVLCPSFSGAYEGDSLEWVRLDPRGIGDLLRLGLSGFGPGWREDPAVDLRACRSGDIASAGIIPATLDGEPTTFLSRVRIEFERRGPRVIALDPEAKA